MSPWSNKDEREFLELARTAKSLDEIVRRTGRTPAAIRRTARRLAVPLPIQIASDTRLIAERDRARKKRIGESGS